MYYGYIYKTTNLINNKVYIGKHEVSYYDPTYLGSGRDLKRAVAKYGKENFSNELLDFANTPEELNQKEIYYISIYKGALGKNRYNLAAGGTGGNTFIYKSEEEKNCFITKMTEINRKRCSDQSFKDRIRECTRERMQSPEERKKVSERNIQLWQDPHYRENQLKKRKEYYETHDKDMSCLFIPHIMILQGKVYQFESRKEWEEYMKDELGHPLNYNIYQNIISNSLKGIGYQPFHKNKMANIVGMMLFKYSLPNRDVTTMDDECNPVESEISTDSKRAASSLDEEEIV